MEYLYYEYKGTFLYALFFTVMDFPYASFISDLSLICQKETNKLKMNSNFLQIFHLLHIQYLDNVIATIFV